MHDLLMSLSTMWMYDDGGCNDACLMCYVCMQGA